MFTLRNVKAVVFLLNIAPAPHSA